ncbi:MAG: methylated-DNA--[protein]-cysteine S-methyltransferase [Gammaproteobacteria bacterium]|nr:methylated-DNA--[protein]-cysteine S-methyltransferase [Gammaproteobacteria bacterium]
MRTLFYDVYQSPIGDITFVEFDDALCYLDFSENSDRLKRLLTIRFGKYRIERGSILEIHSRLDAYFDFDWSAFDGLSITTGGTEFQQSVWRELGRIPTGSAISYQQLAKTINKPKAIRAVASSNARNPISIIIPCHRVIGKNGALRGYAGGLKRKQWLLEHEGMKL